ncbi:MAG: T9SS C-terminal target domain-containing protein [Calditrichaeota bacterium]|nr:MAG: T9SS C-terminal target domain-containing protein [Calditrichota bacterium]
MKIKNFIPVIFSLVLFCTGTLYSASLPINHFDDNSVNLINIEQLDKKLQNFTNAAAPGDPVDFDAAQIAGADYLRRLQADITEDNAGNGNPDVPDDPDDGGWDWALSTFAHTTSASPTNIYGATVMGVYYTYLETGDASLFTVMLDAANQLVATGPSVNRAGADMKFLLLFNELYSNEVAATTVYADAAKAKYDQRLADNGGTATSFGEYIRDVRGVNQGYSNGIIPWDIGIYAVVAQMLFDIYGGTYDADADAFAEVIWQDTYNANPGYFDLVADAGYDPTFANSDYWWYSLGVTGLIDAFAASGSHTAEIPGLITILLECQYSGGGISGGYGANPDDEDWQSTGYAMMTLGNYDQATYQNDINRMGYWLGATQDVSGAWVYSSGNHYPEIGGEATAGLYFTDNINSDVIVDDDFTSQADVDVYNTANSTSYVWGYNAFATIQAAIDAVNGSTVYILNGSYTETLVINEPLTLTGESEAGVIINIPAAGGYGISVTSDDVTLEYFTLATNAANENYPIHASGTPNPPDGYDNLTIQYVTIQNAHRRTGFDIHGYTNVVLSHLTSMDAWGGNGMQITGCIDVTIDNITTSGNAWGSIAIYCSGPSYLNRGSDNVNIDGNTLSLGEKNLFRQDEFGLINTNITIAGYEFLVRNLAFRPDAAGFYMYQDTQADAVAMAIALDGTAVGSYVTFLLTGEFLIVDGMYIQPAIDAASPGESLNVGAGTYTEQLHIYYDDLEIVGAGVDMTTIVSPASLPLSFSTGSNDNYPVVFVDNAVDFVLTDVTIDGAGQGNANYRFVGLGYYNAGGTFTDGKVINVMDTPFSGTQHGVAIYSYNDTGGPFSIVMSDLYVDTFQKNAFSLLGSGLTIDLDNIITQGAGPTTVTAQNGIQIGGGVSGTVDNCEMYDIAYTGATWTATGFLNSGDVTATGLIIDGCQTSVYWIDGSGAFDNGTISNVQGDAFYAYNSTTAKAADPKVQPAIFDAEFSQVTNKTPQTVSVTNSTITGTGAAASWGVSAFSTSPDVVNFNVSGCTIDNWDYGIYAYDYGGPVNVVANGNAVINCTFGMEASATLTQQNAQQNWWGTADASLVAGLISGPVDYSPWYEANYVGDPHLTAWSWGMDNSGTIQDAIDAATSGDFINMATGVYAEGPQIHVDKSLTIAGTDPVTINTTANTGSSGDSRGWFLVDAGVIFNFSDVTLDGTGFNVYQAVRSQGGGVYDNINFTNIVHPGYAGVALAVFGNDNVTISNCDFSNIGRIGALLYGSGLDDSYFINNTYTGKGDGDWLDYAADISAGAVVTVDGCVITNCTGVASSDGSTSAGLLVSTYFGLGTTATITNSSITGNTSGIAVGYDAADESVVIANGNVIADNTDYGISTSGSLVSVNAEYNFWGAYDGPLDSDGTTEAVIGGTCYALGDITNQVAEGFPGDGLGNAVTGDVDYCPWVASDVLMTPDDFVYLCDGSFDMTVSISPSISNMKSISVRVSYPADLSFDGMTLLDANYSSAPVFTWDNASGYDSVQVDMFVTTGFLDGSADLFDISLSGSADICAGDMISVTRAVWKAGLSNDEITAATPAPSTISADCADPVVTINGPVDGGFYNTAPILDIAASDNCDIDYLYYQIDTDGWVAILSGFAGTSYANAAWAIPTVDFDALTEASHCIQFRVVDDLGREGLSTSWCFTKDITAPAPPTELVAEPGHNKVKLSWTNSSSGDVVGVKIQRVAWGDYPTYDTPAPAYPADELTGTNVFDGTGIDLVDNSGLSNATRDIYYYGIFAYDAAGNYSVAAASAQARSTSYWLGDVADNTFTLGNFDGFVHVGDLTVFASSYWKTTGDAGFVADADFGPTEGGTDNGVFNAARGIPVPDDSVQFSDLGIFAINYQTVDNVMKAVPLFADATVNGNLNLRLETTVEGDEVICAVVLQNNSGDAKVIHTAFEYPDNLEYIGFESKLVDNVGDNPIFDKSRTIGSLVEYDMALIGENATISGSGTLAEFRFRITDDTPSDFVFVEGIVFDNNLSNLSADLVVGNTGLLPESYKLSQNYPNPFNPSTEISYQLPQAGNVVLEVFNLLGQKVKTLVDEYQSANSYSITWDGTNQQGTRVTSGVYVYKLTVNQFKQSKKMVLLK